MYRLRALKDLLGMVRSIRILISRTNVPGPLGVSQISNIICQGSQFGSILPLFSSHSSEVHDAAAFLSRFPTSTTLP